MYLENGSDLFRGLMILLFAAIAYWSNFTVGLLLTGLIGVLIRQSAFTNWCPADFFLRLMRLKGKHEGKG